MGGVCLVAEMVSLKLQKRLAVSVLKCGRGKVWLDPNEASEISMANSSALYYFRLDLFILFLLSLEFLFSVIDAC